MNAVAKCRKLTKVGVMTVLTIRQCATIILLLIIIISYTTFI